MSSKAVKIDDKHYNEIKNIIEDAKKNNRINKRRGKTKKVVDKALDSLLDKGVFFNSDGEVQYLYGDDGMIDLADK